MRTLSIFILTLGIAALFAPSVAHAQYSRMDGTKGSDIYGMSGGGSVFSDDEKQALQHNQPEQRMSGVTQVPIEFRSQSNLMQNTAIYGVRRSQDLGVLSGVRNRGSFNSSGGFFH